MFEENMYMAQIGLREGMIGVAYNYEFGTGGAPKDHEKAIYWYEKAGDAESLTRAKALREMS